MKTKHDIEYGAEPFGHIATIPAGTPVIPATNLPDGGWWVEEWEGMDEQASAWQTYHGFLVIDEEVTEDETL